MLTEELKRHLSETHTRSGGGDYLGETSRGGGGEYLSEARSGPDYRATQVSATTRPSTINKETKKNHTKSRIRTIFSVQLFSTKTFSPN